jgi:3-dehydroquinate dehydratase
MRPSFLKLKTPYLAAIVSEPAPELAIANILNGEHEGAEAFMVDISRWQPDCHSQESLKKVFRCCGRPMMPLCYRSGCLSADKISDDERAELIIRCIEAGAAACDLMGDFFAPAPHELTREPEAVAKQKKLIERIHAMGAEVLMSSHIYNEFVPADAVLAHMLAIQERGVDIAKIVVSANTEDELLDAFRCTVLLKKSLQVPFVHLCNGKFARIQRYMAPVLGAALTFGFHAYSAYSIGPQPIIRTARAVLDELTWHQDY